MGEKQTSIRITVVDADTISAIEDKPLLDSLEANNIEAPYHCRDGFCGACRCKLLAGTTEYTIDPLAFIDDDEILLCCSIPLSNVTIALE